MIRGTVGVGSTTTSIVTSRLLPAATVANQLRDRVVVFSDITTTAALRGQVEISPPARRGAFSLLRLLLLHQFLVTTLL